MNDEAVSADPNRSLEGKKLHETLSCEVTVLQATASSPFSLIYKQDCTFNLRYERKYFGQL
jgi:hypothetical protein